MIEPMTSLAFSVYSGRGVYALLLGSGLSRAAQIPTGWEVTLDLIRKIAAMQQGECEPNPSDWYTKTYGKEPDYSELLEGLAVTSAERANALSSYFEATPQEREEGKKIPTAAHVAIADMVSKGYLKVIVTTNFDRLMEQALEAQGISPTVISTSDMVNGAVPLAHSNCTVIKVHGDYRDVRFRNTVAELSEYDSGLSRLLDQVFDEYGLIICGWSGTWDKALRDAIVRSPNRRYSVIWASRGSLTDEAGMIARFKSASVFPIESADQFFTDLAGKLDSLERFNRPHPLSTVIAVASLKKFIVEDRFRIELDELINREAEAQLDGFLDFYRSGSPFLNENFKARLEHYEASTEMLRALVATGCYYGRAEHASIWGRLISRMLEIAAQPIGLNPIAKLRKYPASMLFYAGGVACVASGNLRTLKLLLKDLRTNVDRWVDGKEDFVSRKLAVGFVLDSGSLKQALNDPNNFLPSQHMHDLVRESLRSILPSESQFDASFHRFEYLLSLSYLDEQMRDGARLWPALGLFAQELYSYRSNEPSVIEIISKEEDHEGDLWAPVAAGIFAGRQRFLEVQKVYKETVLPVIANWRAGF